MIYRDSHIKYIDAYTRGSNEDLANKKYSESTFTNRFDTNQLKVMTTKLSKVADSEKRREITKNWIRSATSQIPRNKSAELAVNRTKYLSCVRARAVRSLDRVSSGLVSGGLMSIRKLCYSAFDSDEYSTDSGSEIYVSDSGQSESMDFLLKDTKNESQPLENPQYTESESESYELSRIAKTPSKSKSYSPLGFEKSTSSESDSGRKKMRAMKMKKKRAVKIQK